jgi:hypothetical protein
VWSKGLCRNHIPKKAIPSSCPIPVKKSGLARLIDDAIDEELQKFTMKDFFGSLWLNRKHYSEVSGKYLGSEPLSIYFHHILPKEKYPQAALDSENIIFLTGDEHGNVENDKYRFPEINDRRKKLMIKYNL